jgi:Ca-activated chloride channel family protein
MRVFSPTLALSSLAICLAALLLGSRGSAQGTLVQPGATRTVIVTVTGKKDAPVNALPVTSFGITSKNLIQEIVDLKQADAPISVAIVFDLSGSMGGSDGKLSKRTQSVLAALTRFVQSSNPANEYFFIGFNDKVQLLRGRYQDANAMIAELNSIGARSFRNGTALYDALHFAVNELSHSGFLKQAIVLVTDSSGDNASHATFKDTIRLLEQTNALVYPILLLPEDYSDLYGRSTLDGETKAILTAFASVSGGEHFQAQRSQELNALIDRMAIELRSQYFVGVALANDLEKKCYELKLKLNSANHPELKSSSLRTRKILCVQ